MGDEESDLVEEESESGEGGASDGNNDTSKIVKILLYVAGGILGIVLVIGISYLVSKNVQESRFEKSQDIISAPPPAALNNFELPVLAKTTSDLEPHFIKIKISLGYEANLELNNELVKRKNQILHMINMILQGKKYDDLNNTAGTVDLSEEIKAQINRILISGKIKEVYFPQLVIQ